MTPLAGNVRVRDDALRCIEETGSARRRARRSASLTRWRSAVAVMSACGLLTNPALFDARLEHTPQQLLANAVAYVDFAARYPASAEWCRLSFSAAGAFTDNAGLDSVVRHLNWAVPPVVLRRSPELTALMLQTTKLGGRRLVPAATLTSLRALLVACAAHLDHRQPPTDDDNRGGGGGGGVDGGGLCRYWARGHCNNGDAGARCEHGRHGDDER